MQFEIQPPRRGQRPVLSRAAIGEAALAELDGISSARVAARLGVGHSSLYRYVNSRADLVRLAVDFALEGEAWPEPRENWREYLKGCVDAFWQFLSRYPAAAQEILVMRPSPQKINEATLNIAENLLTFGFSPKDAFMAVDLLGHLVIESMVSEELYRSRGRHGRPALEEQRAAMSANLSSPLAEVSRTFLDQGMYSLMMSRAELLMDGLDLRLTKEPAQTH
ncbi:hypothetical protein [Psychromicrobium xiongbiense]|uniref:hypothetical protein n=1 Tax=Psychromicrobium xiongbiense TaxID=3051184 RepID=UPI002557052A|nr:hypothetical protein [Psychromicrobium sp. YIM S02556]